MHLFCYILLVAWQLADSNSKRIQSAEYDQYDVLTVARCEANCWQARKKDYCIKSCLIKGFEKPGTCLKPHEGTTLSPFASVCLDTCKVDSDCPDIAKCCSHRCGVTCQAPHNIEIFQGLPDIPIDITIKGRRKRSLLIKWKEAKDADGTVVYVIEERHHAGKYFIESHMGDWKPCYRSTRPGIVLKHIIKPGRWYQFRVAAVNANGTKGFSEYIGYIAQTGPRPPKAPQNVVVGPIWKFNNTLHTELNWNPPHSDLPIEKYKVFWSRRLHGVTALDSVLVLQQTIPKEQTRFTIHDLEPDSLYFLQIQAISQFGIDILRGEKSGLVLNTTNYTTNENLKTLKLLSPMRIEDLQLQKLFWSKGDLKARFSWQPQEGIKRYTVSWWAGPCKNHKFTSHFKLAATTKGPHFDIYDLQFDCRYRVSVRQTTSEGMKSIYDTSVTFTTPSCKELLSRNKRVKCNRRRSLN